MSEEVGEFADAVVQDQVKMLVAALTFTYRFKLNVRSTTS
jgi:hypothetical protein